MQIDLSFVFKSPLGKPKLEPEFEENRVPKLDENGNPRMKEITLWDVLEAQLESFSGGEGTKVSAVVSAMVKAMEKDTKVIDINAEMFTFIKEKVIPQAKNISDFFKEQIKEHLVKEEKAHKKQEENSKKKSKEESVEKEKEPTGKPEENKEEAPFSKEQDPTQDVDADGVPY
jgi:hypothetical protein